MKISPLMLIILGAAVWTIGDLFIQFWSENHKNSFLVMGILIWAVGLLFLAFSVLHKNLAVASTMRQ